MTSLHLVSIVALGCALAGSGPARAEPGDNRFALTARAEPSCCDNPATAALGYLTIALGYVRRLDPYLRAHVDVSYGEIQGDETTGTVVAATVGLGLRTAGTRRRYLGGRLDVGGGQNKYEVKNAPCESYEVLGRLVGEAGWRLGRRGAIGAELGLRAGAMAQHECSFIARTSDWRTNFGWSLGLRFEQGW